MEETMLKLIKSCHNHIIHPDENIGKIFNVKPGNEVIFRHRDVLKIFVFDINIRF
jgi:hypothetical protein